MRRKQGNERGSTALMPLGSAMLVDFSSSPFFPSASSSSSSCIQRLSSAEVRPNSLTQFACFSPLRIIVL